MLRAGTLIVCLASLANALALVPGYARAVGAAGTQDILAMVAFGIALASTHGGAALALVLAARGWEAAGSRCLAVFLAAVVSAWGLVLRGTDFNPGVGLFDARVGDTPRFPTAELLFIVVPVAAGAFLRFSGEFPTRLVLRQGATGAARHFFGLIRLLRLRSGLIWALALGLPLATLAVSRIERTVTGNAASVFKAGLAAFALLTVSFPVIALVLGVRNLKAGYELAPPDDRKRILWLVAGVSVGTWMILIPLAFYPLLLVSPSFGWIASVARVLWGVAPGALVSAIAVAMFYTGGVDPKFVLRRSTFVGIGGTVWLITYAALESGLSGLAQDLLGLPDVVVSIAMALLAAAFPLWLRRWSGRTEAGEVEAGQPGRL